MKIVATVISVVFTAKMAFVCSANLYDITTMNWFPVIVFGMGPGMAIATNCNCPIGETGTVCVVSSFYNGFSRMTGSRPQYRIRRSPCVVSITSVAWSPTFVTCRDVQT